MTSSRLSLVLIFSTRTSKLVESIWPLQSGDLIMTSDGDCVISYGLNNIIQKVRIALNTPRNSLIHFPTYGLGLTVGDSVADLDVGQVKSSIQNLFKDDPTFERVAGIKVTLIGSVLKINFGVVIRGTDQTIPISFSVYR